MRELVTLSINEMGAMISEGDIKRPSVAEMDQILGIPFRVLKDGFVRLVDYMGDDGAIVQAARVSYGKGTKHINEDRGLIRYLMRHRHTTPFEMCEVKLHVRVPMDVWRQWIRHRTANVNEYSTRYSIAIESFETTSANEWRHASLANRQGSEGFLDSGSGEGLSAREVEVQQLALEVYKERLAADVAREQARKDLPLSTYTEAYWKIDLHNLLHFLELRMHSHAQLEIRRYATVIGHEIVSRWCPITWDAFCVYRLDGMALSRTELEVITALCAGQFSEATDIAEKSGLIEKDGSKLKRNRERSELEEKLRQLGLRIPWD